MLRAVLVHALCHHLQLDFFGLGQRLVGELGALIVPAPASLRHLRSIPTRNKKKENFNNVLQDMLC